MGWTISSGNLDALLNQSFSVNDSYFGVTMTSGAEATVGGTLALLAADVTATGNPGLAGPKNRTIQVLAVDDSSNSITLYYSVFGIKITLPAQRVIAYDANAGELLLSLQDEASAAQSMNRGLSPASLSVLSLTPLSAGTTLVLPAFSTSQPLGSLPTIGGTIAGQTTTDAVAISPLSNAAVSDPNPGASDTLTVTLSIPGNGTLSNTNFGSYNALTGTYSFTGTAAEATAALQGLLFTPKAHQVVPGNTVSTTLIVKETNAAGLTAVDWTTTIVATAVAVPPTIINAIAGQTTTDVAAIAPFARLTIGDLNFGQTETVTLALSTIANGTLSNLGGGSYNAGTGVYSVSGTAAAVTAALQGLLFTPTPHEVPPGQAVTTGFTITDTDTAGQLVTDNTTTVVAISVAVPPAITGSMAGQTTGDNHSVAPFSTIAITDVNAGQSETVTVTLSASTNGILSNLGTGSYDAKTGIYTVNGTAQAVTTALNGLVFTPTLHQVPPGQSVLTSFVVRDTDTAGQIIADSATTVIATAVAVPLVIAGSLSGQTTNDNSAISPFSSVTISDPNARQTETLTVTVSAPANGSLGHLGGGSYNGGTGIYSVSGSAAEVTAALQGLLFTPTQHEVAPGQAVSTKFTIQVSDAAGQAAADPTTTVVATAVAVPPAIRGAAAGQATNDGIAIRPLAGITITDLNLGQTETVTVTLSAAANGSLSNLAGGSYNGSSGVYSVTGSSAAVTAALQGLVFTPTAHQVPAGQTVTTTFTIKNTDSAGQSVSNSVASVVARSVQTPTTIEAFGSTSLVQIGSQYFMQDQSGAGPSVKFAGVTVTAGQPGNGIPIGAERTPGGYQIVWRNGGQFTVWNTDANGNYVSLGGVLSGGDFALQSLETAFHQDLNGDGTIGPVTTVLETAGSTYLTQEGNAYFLLDSHGNGPVLKSGGIAMVAGAYAGGTPIGAERTTSGYQVVWRNCSQYTVWNTDANGNYLSLGGMLSGGDFALQSLETAFHQDLNGDGTIGPVTTLLEMAGSTHLTQEANYYFLLDAGGNGPALKSGGVAVMAGAYPGWTPIGAERAGGGYQVAWQNGGQYMVWNTDANGNYLSLAGVMSGGDLALQRLETAFHQDLNGDGIIGPVTTVLETAGSTHLTQEGNQYFLLDSLGNGPALKNGGIAVVTGAYGGWTPIGAEPAAGGGYQVALRNGDQYKVWDTDSNGSYVSLRGVWSRADFTLQDLETTFQQDLNGDGMLSTVLHISTSRTDTYDLSATATAATINLGGNTASTSSGLNTATLSFLGVPDSIVLGSGTSTVQYALTPNSGIETITGFLLGRDMLNIDLLGAGNAILRAFDTSVNGTHAIALASSADLNHGVALLGQPAGQTASDLLTNHTSYVDGHVLIR